MLISKEIRYNDGMNKKMDISNTKQSKKKDNSSVQAVERALTLLKLIANSSASVSVADLAIQTNMNRTTVWRLLTTLELQDFVERDPVTKGYQLGFAALNLVSEKDKYSPLIRRALPTMKRLLEKVEESVLLSVPKPLGVLTIQQINPPNQHIRVVDYLNMTLPLHATSNGKLLLSYLSKSELDILLNQPLEKLTPHTITDRNELLKEVDQIRKQGFATNFGELDESENGLSAPILDEQGNLVAFISLSGPSFRFTKEKVFDCATTIIKSAKEIADNLKK